MHYLDAHVNKYVFLPLMSLLLKRASVVSDRSDIVRVRRRRINTRDVHVPVSLPSSSLSLSLASRLSASASSTSEVYLRVSLRISVPAKLAPQA